jgi:hypothetical protein
MFSYILQIAVLYGSFCYLLPFSESVAHFLAAIETTVVIFLDKCVLHYSSGVPRGWFRGFKPLRNSKVLTNLS